MRRQLFLLFRCLAIVSRRKFNCFSSNLNCFLGNLVFNVDAFLVFSSKSLVYIPFHLDHYILLHLHKNWKKCPFQDTQFLGSCPNQTCASHKNLKKSWDIPKGGNLLWNRRETAGKCFFQKFLDKKFCLRCGNYGLIPYWGWGGGGGENHIFQNIRQNFYYKFFLFYKSSPFSFFSPWFEWWSHEGIYFLRKKKKFKFQLNFLFLKRNRKVGFGTKQAIEKICFWVSYIYKFIYIILIEVLQSK